MSYLGLDIGTSGCKAIIFDARGNELARDYREYALTSPREGWAELDSELVMDLCCTVIRSAASSCPLDPVQALAISSQGEAFTPVGPSGEILANAMVSSDSRAASLASSWSNEFGAERLYQITGHTAHPMFSLYKLLWLRENRPEIWAGAVRFLCFEDLMQQRMGLDPAMGYPLAGRTMLFDVNRHDWSDEILSAIGLTRSKLSRPLPSGTVSGKIPENIARDLGVCPGALVVTGGHDQICSALGAGVTRSGVAMLATGTVECICPAFQEARFSRELFESNLCTYDFALENMFATVAFSLTGGNLLRWFRDQWGEAEVVEARKSGKNPYEVLLSQIPAGPTRLLVLPYFTPSGTPYFDYETPGAILGLRLTTSRAEILRALLEGVAFEMRLNLDILARSGVLIHELITTGGGARSRIWTQLKADVLNIPIRVATHTESGCFGAAMLAQAAHTGEPVASLLENRLTPGELLVPNPAHTEFYTKRFDLYREVYPSLRKLK
jgi:xylulokinase